jgi:hypothetical protein
MALPGSYGGMSIPKYGMDEAIIAYEASISEYMSRCDGGNLQGQQHLQMKNFYVNEGKSLSEVQKSIIEETSRRGVSSWMHSDNSTSWGSPYVMALRHRLNWNTPDEAHECPGCGFEMRGCSLRHVSGCTSCHTSNATTRHNTCRDWIVRRLQDANIECVKEPRDFEVFTCNCGHKASTREESITHNSTCRMHRRSWRSGPDIAVTIEGKRTLYDFSVVNKMAPSYDKARKNTEDAFYTRSSAKEKLYCDSLGIVSKDDLQTISMSSHGVPSAPLIRLLRLISINLGTDLQDEITTLSCRLHHETGKALALHASAGLGY